VYNKIEWQSEYSPADINAIRTVENNFGIVFPEDYLEVAQKYHGGEPSSKTIFINDKKVVFGYLLTFLAFDEIDILDKYNSERNYLPKKHFPFAIDEEGNMFCFNFSDINAPNIVFVEKGNTATASFVAQNFLDFIHLLN
jgi:hypothetical protein